MKKPYLIIILFHKKFCPFSFGIRKHPATESGVQFIVFRRLKSLFLIISLLKFHFLCVNLLVYKYRSFSRFCSKTSSVCVKSQNKTFRECYNVPWQIVFSDYKKYL